jgi:hypothetical protein
VIRTRASKSAPVGVVSKILRLLEALNASSTGLRLKDIAEQTAINKSTAYRFLAHLETERYLYRDEYGAYMVGPKLVRLGSGISYQTTLRRISRPLLHDLWKVTSETVNLGIFVVPPVRAPDAAHDYSLIAIPKRIRKNQRARICTGR